MVCLGFERLFAAVEGTQMNLASERFVVPRSDPARSSTVCHVNLLNRLATPPAVCAARGHFSLEATLSPAVAAAVEPSLDLVGVEAQAADPLARRHPFGDPVAPPSLAEAEALLELGQGNESSRLGAIELGPEGRRCV